MAANDRGYGHGRFAGAFAVVERQSEMRAMNYLIARQPANAHRRVLPAGRSVVIQSSFISVILISVCQRNKSVLFLVFSCQPAEITR